jgi:hypothetical protein
MVSRHTVLRKDADIFRVPDDHSTLGWNFMGGQRDAQNSLNDLANVANVAQSTTATFQGRSDSVKSSSAARRLTASPSGWSPK